MVDSGGGVLQCVELLPALVPGDGGAAAAVRSEVRLSSSLQCNQLLQQLPAAPAAAAAAASLHCAATAVSCSYPSTAECCSVRL